jgi:polyphenol oxidase
MRSMLSASSYKILKASNLAQENLIHGFTTQELASDYTAIANEVEIDSQKIFYVKQIHSGKVVCIDENTKLESLPEADALITNQKGIIVGVRTADCVPVLVYDAKQKVVTAIHAGYRGVLNQVIQASLKQMKESYDCCMTDLKIAIGPCVCMQHYEVGEELIQEFKDVYDDGFVFSQEAGQKPRLDVKETAKLVLQNLGVQPDQIDDLNMCTFEHEDLFYSYRRDKTATGRQFNFVGFL